MTALGESIRRLFPPLRVGRKLWTAMAVLVVYGLVVSAIISIEHLPDIEWGAESTVLNGLVLSFLIAFRNNHAYDRWWEARKLWGQLTNVSRNFCLKIQTLDNVAARDREAVAQLIITFDQELTSHLRRPYGSDEDQRRAMQGEDLDHEPLRVAGRIYELIALWHRQGLIDGWALLWLDGEIRSLMDICGACERIRNTPLSASYRALLRHGIAIYLAVAPFYLIEDTGIAGFPMFILAAYFLLGIELVAEEIEEPFGAGGDNLPLDRYCSNIERSVRKIIATLDNRLTGDAATASPDGSSQSRPERTPPSAASIPTDDPKLSAAGRAGAAPARTVPHHCPDEDGAGSTDGPASGSPGPEPHEREG
jgi:ion channel-forming bestrophin family protein